jgi:hypothetical protein
MSKYQSKISQKATYLRVYDGGRMLYGEEVTDVIHNLEKRIVELEKELSSLVRGIKDLGSISYDQYPDTKTAENILNEHKL